MSKTDRDRKNVRVKVWGDVNPRREMFHTSKPHKKPKYREDLLDELEDDDEGDEPELLELDPEEE